MLDLFPTPQNMKPNNMQGSARLRPRRRLAPMLRRALACLGLSLLLLEGMGGMAAGGAQETVKGEKVENGGPMMVVQVQGLIDPVNADLIVTAIDDAKREGSPLLVLHLDSPGALDVDVSRVVRAVEESTIPVAVWIGPIGASARGAAVLLAAAAHVVVMSPRSTQLGPVFPVALDREKDAKSSTARAEVLSELRRLAKKRGRPARSVEALDGRLDADRARELGLVDLVKPSIGEAIVALDGRMVRTEAGEQRLQVAQLKKTDDGPRRSLAPVARNVKLDFLARMQHTFTSSPVAYVLFVIGISLVIFEFFSVGVGLAGFVGALAFVAAMFGFSHLPANPWAVALIIIGLVGLSIDLQAGVLAFWTVVGALMFLVGSLNLYGGASSLDVPLWIVIVTTLGVILFMLGGMTAVVRARFSTPTIGREWMIGELGVARVRVAPDGVVDIGGALWRARTNRATPIDEGGAARVVAVEGLVLEVEPEEGGARDAGH